MELIFQEQKQSCLRRILDDTVSQEQTADVIIPDSIPDADRVVDAFGTVLVRSETCTAAGVELSGVVQTGALIVDEQGTIYSLKSEIPFSLRRDFPQPEEDCRMQCICTLRSVDARLVNSRKLLLRVGIACKVQAYAPKEVTQYDLPQPAENLQLRRMELPLRVPMGMGERSFTVNEELTLPEGKTAIARLLKCLYRTKITEQRMVGNKAVFKGEILVHTLYEDTEQKLGVWQWTIPFSQYAEQARELDDGDLQTFLTMTGAEAEPDSQFESRRLLVSIHLLAQCVTLGVQNICMIEDAFCTDGELKPQFEEWSMAGVLDRQIFHENATYEGDRELGNVVDAWAYREEGEKHRDGEAMVIEQGFCCNILYYDGEGALQGTSLRPVATVGTALASNADCTLSQATEGEVSCTCKNGQVTLRVPVEMTVDSTALHRFKVVKGATVEPFAHTEGRRPAAILRRAEEDGSVWDIAKYHHTSVDAILAANGLDRDEVSKNTMLLIPT